MKNALVKVSNTMSKSLAKTKFSIQKNSPQLLLGAGIAGLIGSTIMACMATTKVKTIMENMKEEKDLIESAIDKFEEYSEKDRDKDLYITYVKTGLKVFNTYLPSILIGTASIASILTSHNIMKQRNVALSVALSATEKAYATYRNRVKERFGENVDNELLRGIKKEEIIDENGKTKKVKTANTDANPYSFWFSEEQYQFDKNFHYNKMFLEAEQSHFNDLLEINGKVFLNDVLERLGIPKTKAGQIVGWTWDPDNTEVDSYIDFGIGEQFLTPEKDRLHHNGKPAILLEFNCDGDVWSPMKN